MILIELNTIVKHQIFVEFDVDFYKVFIFNSISISFDKLLTQFSFNYANWVLLTEGVRFKPELY